MNALGILLLLVAFLVLVALVLGWLRTYKMEHGDLQGQFEKGVANIAALDGDYTGVAHGLKETSWQGKTLTRANHMGINRFVKNGVPSSNYPFQFFIAKGLRDTALDVIVLDYNQIGNPWWLKYIVDEMVEVAPQEYLGKVHVKIAPSIIFTLGYFTLSK